MFVFGVVVLLLLQLHSELLELGYRNPWELARHDLVHQFFLPILPAPKVLLEVLLVGLLCAFSLLVERTQLLLKLLENSRTLLQQRLTRDFYLAV